MKTVSIKSGCSGVDVAELDRLLDLLIGSPRPLARAALGRLLSVSPSGMGRRLEQLRALNVPVGEGRDGVFVDCADTLDARAIAAGLADMPTPPHVEMRRLCESTNRLAASGETPGLYLAELQMGGHGRRGSAWRQAFASGIALSCAVRMPLQRFDGLAVALAVAVVGALEALGYAGIRLKWPNDLYFHDAKLGGLMVQAEGGRSPRLVVGLGLNVHEAPRLEERATAALDQVALPGLTRNALATGLARALSKGLDKFARQGFSGFAEEYHRLDILAGRAVRLVTAEGPVDGVVRGVGEVGELAIETPAGLCHYAAGEVSLGACRSI